MTCLDDVARHHRPGPRGGEEGGEEVTPRRTTGGKAVPVVQNGRDARSPSDPSVLVFEKIVSLDNRHNVSAVLAGLEP